MRVTGFLSAALLALTAATPVAGQDVALPEGAAAWSVAERELMVPVDGGNVWVRVNGDLEAEILPVVFIHGGPGGTHVGFGSMLGMADERAVILYDQLDSGMSERPNDTANWRVERFVEELDAIREALGIERWHLVGHSWGSALALEYSAAYPEHTASAVLSGTFISTPHWIMGTNLLIRDLPDEVAADLIACESDMPPPQDVCEAATSAFYAEYNGRPDRPQRTAEAAAYRTRYSGQGFNGTTYNGMWGPSEFSARGTLVNYDATPLLSRIDGDRTMFMIGQYDEAHLDTVQDFVTLTPGAEFAVIPGASHASFYERPAIVEAILRSWLARMDQRDNAE